MFYSRYNDSFVFSGHQMMTVDKQEGVYAGGKAEYTGVRTFEVYSDFAKGQFKGSRGLKREE